MLQVPPAAVPVSTLPGRAAYLRLIRVSNERPLIRYHTISTKTRPDVSRKYAALRRLLNLPDQHFVDANVALVGPASDVGGKDNPV